MDSGHHKTIKKKKKVRFFDEHTLVLADDYYSSKNLPSDDDLESPLRQKIDESFSSGMDMVALGIPVKNEEQNNNTDINKDSWRTYSKLVLSESESKTLRKLALQADLKKKKQLPCLPPNQGFSKHINVKDISAKDEEPASPTCHSDFFFDKFNRWNKAADNLAENLWIHMNLRGSISESIWGKLSLGAKILTEGGVENLFRIKFIAGPNEKLLKTSACYLSTDAGPMPGLLFISSEKLAFCSERPIALLTTRGLTTWSYYKVAIPLVQIATIKPCGNMYRAVEKYILVETVDSYEFWFMGFVHYDKALKYINEAMKYIDSKNEAMKYIASK